MADQLTPRVVRTVEELADLPDGAVVWDRHKTPIAKADGRWYACGGGLYDVHPEQFRLPATVLAPPSVTAEQVALITDPRYPDGRAFGPVFTDSVHEAFRRGVDTALAAMGIPVVDSE